MRAVVWRAPGRVEVADVPDARLEDPADALVRVTTTAICGSDLHFLHGKAPLEPGDVMGHEAVGVVEAVGEDVSAFAPGDRVVVAFNIACGRCWFCRSGQTSLCEEWRNLGAGVFGGGLAGAQAELVRVPAADANLLAIPRAVDDDRAVFVGDVLSSAVYAVELAGVAPGDVVAVVGAGPLGFLAVQVAMTRGPAAVIAIDLEPARLELAERAGAVAVNASERNAQTAVSERTDGRGADVVIEAVGSAAGFDRALDVVRRGGRVIVAGVFSTEIVQAQLGVWWARAIDLRFTGVCPVHAVWRRTMDGVGSGGLDPTPLISHRLSLEDAPRGYRLFDDRAATKVLLRP